MSNTPSQKPTLLYRLLTAWDQFQSKSPLLFGFILILFIGYGAFIASRGEIEAFPEFTNVQVQVITQLPGKAAEEVERLATVPIEVGTTGVPGLINQRSISIFGLSVVTLTFDDSVNSKDARIDTDQRLHDVDLPEGVKADLSPDTTPVGEIYRYTLGGDRPLDELRLIEDWQLEREFKSIPGVADVVSFGGPLRTVEIKVDIPRIKALGLTIASVAQAIGQNHANAGGAMITHGEEAYVVRSIGLFEKPENFENAVIATQKNIPIRVRDIGTVSLGHKPRLGLVGNNDHNDVVEGIILLRHGADSLSTCAEIRARIQKLNTQVLPKGVSIHPIYDRTDLIMRSSHTVFHNIFFGIGLVCLILLVGLGFRYWPLTLMVALIIPFSLLTVFTVLSAMKIVPNLISLGAVDFGIIIETAIFAAEGMIVSLSRMKKRDSLKLTETFSEVLGPALLCALLLVIAFIPILSLQRVEGRIFRPLGLTLIAALIGGQIGTLVFLPIGARFCPVGNVPRTKVDDVLDVLSGFFESFGKKIAAIPNLMIISGGVLLVAIIAGLMGLGREFLPQLNEGSLYIRATAPSTVSLEASTELAGKIRARLKEIPEVVDVVTQIGRPDDGTDVNGFDNIEALITLTPPDDWKTAKTIEGLTKIAEAKMEEFKGVDFNFSQPIKDNVDEAISGVKGELVLKVFGNNLNELQKIANQIDGIMKSVPGAADVGTEQLLGQPELRFSINRDLLDRYGLKVTDAEDGLESALMGKVASKMTDDQGRSVDIVVKPEIPQPPTIGVLSSIPILSTDGAKIPLGDVANATLVEGVSHIYREQGERRIAIKSSVRARPVVDFVNEADKKIRAAVKLPEKFRMQWSGSFENADRASHQLMLVVPVCVVAIVVLLFTFFGSWTSVGFVIWEIPFSALGGFVALRIFGLNFSISAAAGGIVLVGVTLLTGIMLVSEWRHIGDIWAALRERSRSILVSNGVAIIGLIPAAFSHGIGSETAKPFAVMILGGLCTSLVLSLLLLPALISRHQVRSKSASH